MLLPLGPIAPIDAGKLKVAGRHCRVASPDPSQAIRSCGQREVRFNTFRHCCCQMAVLADKQPPEATHHALTLSGQCFHDEQLMLLALGGPMVSGRVRCAGREHGLVHAGESLVRADRHTFKARLVLANGSRKKQRAEAPGMH